MTKTKTTEVQEASTVVERVTLHPDGARVLRRGRAKAGWVSVQDLPLSMLSDGLQLEPDHGCILAREDTCALLQLPPSEYPDRKERLTTLKAELRSKQEEAMLLTKWGKHLESQEVRIPVTREENVEVPNFAHWETFDKELNSEREALRKKLCILRDDVESIHRDIEKTGKGIIGPAQAPTITRGIRFLLEGEGEISFAIEYSVRGARWVPSYRLDLKSDDDKSAVLRVMGMCANASGEDWSNAKIRLSTAAMKREVALPELTSWRLGRKQPRPKPAFRAPPEGLDALFQSYDVGKRSALVVHQSPSAPMSGGSGSGNAPPEPDDDVDVFRGGIEEMEPASQMRSEASMLMDAGEMLGSMEDFDDDIDEELDALEEEWDDDTGEMAMELSLEEVAPVVGRQSKESAKAMPSAPMVSMSMPAPAPQMSRSRRGSPRKKRSMNRMEFGSGGGGGFDLPDTAFDSEEDAGSASWRHETLKLRDAGDGHRRGRLYAVGEQERLLSLLEGASSSQHQQLAQALQASRHAEHVLAAGRLPQGTFVPDPQGVFLLFDVDKPVHRFPSDGRYHRVEIETHSGAAKQELRGIPREGEDVFRFCKLDESSGSTPRGPLAVFEDGVFVVQSELRDEPGQAQREVGLGVEPGVLLKNRVVHISQEEKGLMSPESHVDHEVRFEVVSSLKSIREVFIFDRLPHPEQGEKLEVELLECAPKPERIAVGPSQEILRAGLKWRVVLEPGEVRKIVYRYRISLPAKEEVVGGNRREH